MQPLNTNVSPRSLSTIGWAPWADRSMIDSRRCPNATGPCATTPSESGPRDVIAPVIRTTAPTSAACPSTRISPQIPHMFPASVYVESAVLTFTYSWRGENPGVLAAPAVRRVDDPRPAAGDPGQRRRYNLRRWRSAGTGPKMNERAQVDVVRVDAVTVEGGMGGQGNQLLGDEPLRLGDQLTPTRLQRGIG